MPRCVRILSLIALMGFAVASVFAVQPRPTGERDPLLPAPKAHLFMRSSGFIFAGTVKAVRKIAPQRRGEVATVEVSFHVDHAIRGVRSGQTLTVREWAGLWETGERYRPGERVLLFLYPPSKLGLTSPVGGPLGRFKLDDAGRVLGPGKPGRDLLGGQKNAGFESRDHIPVREFMRLLAHPEVE